MIKNLIFDFDGTIADTLENGIKVANVVAKKYGIKEIDLNNIERLRNTPLKVLLKEFGIPKRKLPFFVLEFQKTVRPSIVSCSAFPWIREILENLSSNYSLYMLTSNSLENVVPFLEKYDLTKFFLGLDSESNLFGKARALKKMMKKYKLDINESVYIGDELRDIEACKKIDLKIISVAWGFNTETLLETGEPNFIAKNQEEFLKIINSHPNF